MNELMKKHKTLRYQNSDRWYKSNILW